MSAAPASTPRLAAVYWVVWAAAFLPATSRPWWYLDDFPQADYFESGNIRHHLEQGRPGQLLWMMTFALDGGPERGLANVVLRLAQGALHALAAALAARWLAPGSWAAGLPFLLWPYGIEAVGWRSAGTYPLAAVTSLAGTGLVSEPAVSARRRVAAACLIGAAMMTNQSAACAGLVVWTMGLGLAGLHGRRMPGGHEALAVLAGYAGGGLAGLLLGVASAGAIPDRLEPAADLGMRLEMLRKASQTLLVDAILYPAWLGALQVALLASAALGGLATFASHAERRRATAAAALGVCSALVTPYASLLAVDEHALSWRLLYLGPLLLSGAWAFSLASLPPSAIARCTRLLLAGVLAADAWLARGYSGIFPELFDADRRQLARIEEIAREAGLAEVLYVGSEDVPERTLDPYRLERRWGGPKTSSLSAPWAAVAFTRWFSRLEATARDAARGACIGRCLSGTAPPGFRIHADAETGAVCVCPP